MTRELLAAPEMVDTLRGIVQRAARLPAVDGASVTLRDLNSTHTITSDDDVVVADALQYELGEGPCAIRGRVLGRYVVEDLAHDPCWPAWGTQVAELGIASMISIQAVTVPEVFAAVNLYSKLPRRYTQDDLISAHAVAAQVSRVLARVGYVGRVESTVDVDPVVGAAQTVVMTTYFLDADQAFELLSRLAQDNDVSLHAVSQQLLDRR